MIQGLSQELVVFSKRLLLFSDDLWRRNEARAVLIRVNLLTYDLMRQISLILLLRLLKVFHQARFLVNRRVDLDRNVLNLCQTYLIELLAGDISHVRVDTPYGMLRFRRLLDPYDRKGSVDWGYLYLSL